MPSAHGSPRADHLWQPLAPDQIESSIQAAATPHVRLAIALAAVHAARHGQIRALQLSDIDLAKCCPFLIDATECPFGASSGQ